MGYSKRIEIHLKTAADTSGIAKLRAQLPGVGAAAAKLGEAFGGANAYLGRFVQNLLKGSVWMMGAELIGFVFKKTVEWVKTAEAEERAATRSIGDALGACASSLDRYKASLEAAYAAETKAADAALKARQAELDVTDRLSRATVELARQRRIAAGEDAGAVNAEADAALRGQSARTARERADAEVAALRRKVEVAEDEAEAARAEERRIRDAVASMEEGSEAYAGNRELERRHGRLVRAAGRKAEEVRREANAADGRAEAGRKALKDALAARAAVDAEAEAAELRASNERRAREADAAKARAAAEADAARKAAAERDRLDRELHQRRMADLREEIAAQSKAAAPLKAVAAAAQGEFERAFAMYRDPSRAAAEVGEEKARAADLERLHADAARYGGKWRIGELSRLMAAGDVKGQSDALASWRKSSRFTPEVEAMVRASAAEQARTTAEDELRKISANTEGLAAKLDELISAK